MASSPELFQQELTMGPMTKSTQTKTCSCCCHTSQLVPTLMSYRSADMPSFLSDEATADQVVVAPRLSPNVGVGSYTRLHTPEGNHPPEGLFAVATTPEAVKEENPSKCAPKPSLPEPDFERLKSESERLKTFDHWSVAYIDTGDLASAGFYYLGTRDKVQCVFCRVILGSWSEGDQPYAEHARHVARCPFIMAADSVGNVPLQGRPDIQQLFSVPEQTRYITTEPQYPQYSNARDRLYSFKFCRSSTRNTRIPQLAAAGFFYSATEDCVVCFHCGGQLSNWRFSTNPWEDHVERLPRCRFVYNSEIVPDSRLEPTDLDDVSSSATDGEILTKPSVMKSACEVFQKSLVEKVVQRHEKETGKGFESVNDLCETIFRLHGKLPVTETDRC